jgi:extracellular factor (EF) 3-hydroxypalmitic acid methyl ester biosynthesis protein
MTVELVRPLNGATPVVLGQTLLDEVYEQLNLGQIDEGMKALMPGLNARRLAGSSRDWAKMAETCLRHPLRELLHEDPFTRRAFTKPRGYAGDAVLLDYIYGREEGWPPPDGTSALGCAVFDYLTRTPACEGVRARRGFIADLLDRLVEDCQRPHVLSIAAGHLREASLSSAVRRKKIGRYVALDGDAESMKEVERCYGRFGVETAQVTVRQLLTQRLNVGTFDLIYSTGLFDYLQEGTAQCLAGIMFQMLRPGGRLLVANFLPGIADLGYMESYMDWKLIFRTRQEMVSVSGEIPQAQIRDVRIFAEENQTIIFLQITKR